MTFGLKISSTDGVCFLNTVDHACTLLEYVKVLSCGKWSKNCTASLWKLWLRQDFVLVIPVWKRPGTNLTWVDLPFKGKLSPWSPDTADPLHSGVVANPSEPIFKRSAGNKTLNHADKPLSEYLSWFFLIKHQKCSTLDHLKHDVGNENSQTWMHCCRLVSLPQKRGDDLNNPFCKVAQCEELHQASRVLLNSRLTSLCLFLCSRSSIPREGKANSANGEFSFRDVPFFGLLLQSLIPWLHTSVQSFVSAASCQ